MKKKVHQLIRPQALEAYNKLSDGIDPVLQNGPSWTVWTYRILVACLLTAVLFSLIAQIHTYADGVGFVRLAHDQQVVAKSTGTVEQVRVNSGDWVAAGDVLVEFHARSEQNQLQQAENEYAATVRRWLFDPTTGDDVVQARNRMNTARARREERMVRAQAPGMVRDVRVRQGQPVTAGQVLVTQGEGQHQQTMNIFLPGQLRPRLEVGQKVILDFDGHRFAQKQLELSRIDSELIGIGEARGQIGFGLGDVLALEGPLIRAEAQIVDPYFDVRGERYPLHEGMTARAQVILETEPLALAFLPDFGAN